MLISTSVAEPLGFPRDSEAERMRKVEKIRLLSFMISPMLMCRCEGVLKTYEALDLSV